MPIRGLTTNARATQVRIGKLRKGEPKTNPNSPGEDIDGAFRFTAEDNDPDIQAAFESAYGRRPEYVDAFLATKSLDDAWECWKEEWTASSLQHRCDGIKCIVWQDKDFTYHHVNWNEARQVYTNDLGQEVPLDKIPDCPGGCKQVGRLQVILPEMVKAGYVGPMTLETHSKHDILSLQGCLDDLDQKSGGNLSGILLRIYRASKEITATYANKRTGEVKRHKVTKSLIQIRPSIEWVRAQLEGAQQHALLALAAGAPEDEQDADTTMLIEGEFEEIDMDAPPDEDAPEDAPPKEEAPSPATAKPARPFDPETLRAEIVKLVAMRPGQVTPTTAQIGGLRASIKQATGGDTVEAVDQSRHLLLDYLLGHSSSKDITGPEYYALNRWLKPTKTDDGDWIVDETASIEAKAVTRQAMQDQGQESLL